MFLRIELDRLLQVLDGLSGLILQAVGLRDGAVQLAAELRLQLRVLGEHPFVDLARFPGLLGLHQLAGALQLGIRARPCDRPAFRA